MAGVVLETLSSRKLITLGVILLLLQLAFFLLGGLIAPAPSNVQLILGTKCVDTGKHVHKASWYYPRGKGACDSIKDFSEKRVDQESIRANQIVFSFQFPLPRENEELDMSRWFQNIISVLQVEAAHSVDVPQGEHPVLTMDARLGYRNKGDEAGDWKEIARSTEERTMQCEVQKDEDGYPMKCELMQFFELGSCHHDYYLVNIRLPVHDHKNMNTEIGKITDLWLVAISQNGGFTKVWFSIKTVVFPALLAVLMWFWRRIAQLERAPMLLEKMLFALGLALSFLNLPVEWLTLWINMPFMLLLTDIRQGIFYAILLCFWIIFAGEHMMDSLVRNRLVMYWKHLSAVLFGCICLFVFELCERGVQLTNPFYSIWVTDTGTKLALAFIILAGIAACLYFLFLCYMIFRVFRNISAKKLALPQMSSARRKFYSGLIFRFKFLMLTTLVAAAITVIFFIISHVSEGHWKWGEENKLEYTSAFFCGVYGMWNLYIICLLILYAPSHKLITAADSIDDSAEEEVEFSTIPTETSALSTFTKTGAPHAD